MISIVVPLYNKASYIQETLNSVLEQTYKTFEIIVVNDGSTDASVSIVKNMNDTRIRLISIENSGVSVARNTGIKTAKYPWIAFLDGDDWWGPTFLEEMVKAITHYPSEVLFASGRCRVFVNKEERYDHNLLPKDGETAVLNYFKVIANYLPLINASNVVVKRSHFDEAGFFRKGQKQHEDHDLWIRLANTRNVVFINKNLSYYLKSQVGSASGKSYESTDFKIFLKTIFEVSENTSEENNGYLKHYASRFATLTYLKNYGRYSNEERRLLNKPLEKLISGKYKYLYILSKLVPFNLYLVLKKLKK